MKKSGGKYEFWRYAILFWMGLAMGLFLTDGMDVATSNELTVFGLSALISGCVTIWFGSFIIPAGYDPSSANAQTRLIQLTAMFLPVMVLIIVLYFLRVGLAMAPVLAPVAGIVGYFAGCKIAQKNEKA
jgi:hypothetical protein